MSVAAALLHRLFAALQTWRRVFDSFDSDRDGFITQADLQKTPEFTVAKAQKLKGEKENLNRESYTIVTSCVM